MQHDKVISPSGTGFCTSENCDCCQARRQANEIGNWLIRLFPSKDSKAQRTVDLDQ